MPSWYDNLKAALTGQRKPRTVTAAVPLWADWTANYNPTDAATMAREGYGKNEVIFAAIERRALSVAKAPLRVYRLEDGESTEVPDHPLRALFRKPNPSMSEGELWRYAEAWKIIAGNVYFEIERTAGGDPIALHPMRPDRVKIRRTPAGLQYLYTFNGWEAPPLAAENVWHIKNFSAVSDLYGQSELAVAARTGDSDNNLTDFVTAFFQHGANPQGVLSSDQPVNEAEAKRVQARFREVYGGHAKWSDVLVLGAGLKYERSGSTFREMEFGALDGRNEARICQVLQVPPILINAVVGLNRSTFANYQEARRAFYEGIVSDEWDFIASQARESLLPMLDDSPDLDVRFDTSRIPALQENETERVTRVTVAWEKGIITRNEARDEMGYDPDETPLGDEYSNGDNSDATVQAENDAQAAAIAQQRTAQLTSGKPDAPADDSDEADAAEEDAKKAEAKKALAFYRKRVKEGKAVEAGAFGWKYHSDSERGVILEAAGVKAALPRDKREPQRKEKAEKESELAAVVEKFLAELGQDAAHAVAVTGAKP